MNKDLKPKSKKSKQQKKFKALSKQLSTGTRSSRAISIAKGTNVGNPAFFKALTDPFNPESLGCQVPDPFPFPTETFHVHQTSVLGTVGTATTAAVLILPNPLTSLVDITHINNLLVPGVQCVSSTSMTPYGTTFAAPSSAIYGAISQSNLNLNMSTYRVVSWGVKISSLQPQLSATGRYFVSYLPCGDTMPTGQDIALATNPGIVSPMVSMNSASLNSSIILECPTAFEFTAADLMRGDIQLAGMYTNSNYWTFKSTIGAGASGANFMGDDVSVTVANLVTSSYKDAYRCVGGCGIALFAEGLPAGAANQIQIETIYHLEGTPNFTGGSSNSTLVPSVGRVTNVGTQNNVDVAMIAASALKNTVKFLKEGAQFLNDNKQEMASVGRQIGNMFMGS